MHYPICNHSTLSCRHSFCRFLKNGIGQITYPGFILVVREVRLMPSNPICLWTYPFRGHWRKLYVLFTRTHRTANRYPLFTYCVLLGFFGCLYRLFSTNASSTYSVKFLVFV